MVMNCAPPNFRPIPALALADAPAGEPAAGSGQQNGCTNSYVFTVAAKYNCWYILNDVRNMITAAQLKAARALLGIDQRALAEAAGLSLPTIQRMETSDGTVRGNVDSLVKLIDALDALGIEVIGAGAASQGGGRGVRLKE